MQKFNCCLYSYSTQTSPFKILKVQTRKQPEMNFHLRKHILWSLFFKQQFSWILFLNASTKSNDHTQLET